MGFTAIDILNLIALFISMAGSFLMFYFSPVASSKIILYTKAEMPERRATDAYKNKMARRGMLLLLIGFILQASAIFLSVAYKK